MKKRKSSMLEDIKTDIQQLDETSDWFSESRIHFLTTLLRQTQKNIPIIQLRSQFPASELLLRADDRFLFSDDWTLLPAAIRQRLDQ